MGSSGGGGSSASQQYYQQQQLIMQQQQMDLQQRQHEESMALQREALDKPIAAIAKNVSSATEQIVGDQETARNNLRGIRSTYSQFAKKAKGAETDDAGKTKLGD